MAAGPVIRLWDWPVRLVHAGLILLVPLAWWTQEEGHMEWHQRAGLLLFGLVLFRILWGLFGSETARFTHFLKGPGAVLAYLRGGPWSGIGHNPLGGWSVALLLLLLLAQPGLGLFASDSDGLVYGPLNHLVGYRTAERLTDLHGLVFNILLAFVGLHVAAILWYRLARREDLVTPMITGNKPMSALPTGTASVAPAVASAQRALLLLALSLGLAWWIGRGVPLPG
jgi:cytochrome b